MLRNTAEQLHEQDCAGSSVVPGQDVEAGIHYKHALMQLPRVESAW